MANPLDIPDDLLHLIEKRDGEDRRDPNRQELPRDATGNPIDRRDGGDRRSDADENVSQP